MIFKLSFTAAVLGLLSGCVTSRTASETVEFSHRALFSCLQTPDTAAKNVCDLFTEMGFNSNDWRGVGSPVTPLEHDALSAKITVTTADGSHVDVSCNLASPGRTTVEVRSNLDDAKFGYVLEKIRTRAGRLAVTTMP